MWAELCSRFVDSVVPQLRRHALRARRGSTLRVESRGETRLCVACVLRMHCSDTCKQHVLTGGRCIPAGLLAGRRDAHLRLRRHADHLLGLAIQCAPPRHCVSGLASLLALQITGFIGSRQYLFASVAQ